METSNLRLKTLVRNVYREMLNLGSATIDSSSKNLTIVKVNNDELSRRGDLCFLANLKAWKTATENETTGCEDILAYYLRRNDICYENTKEMPMKAFENLIQVSNDWPIRINKCSLQNERVCIFLNRSLTCSSVISMVLSEGKDYGKFKSSGHHRSYSLELVPDPDSELTNLRLRVVKSVSENIIKAHGYRISDDSDTERYKVTIKSKIGGQTLLCGVVRNSETGTKDVTTTESEYRAKRLSELSNSAENKFAADNIEESKLIAKQLTEAAVAFELLSMQPSRALVVDMSSTSSDRIFSTKGSSFVLYNAARMSAIFEKFDEECANGSYPYLSPIEQVDFSVLNEEEEWELVYNFLLGYPDLIETTLRSNPNLEICPQHICSFLSRLCNKFSAYYRRVRILTEGRDHLLATTMTRLYLLKSIQIVCHNALALLNLNPISRM